MDTEKQFLSPAEAATKLGVSTKTLRLYEQRALISPIRSEAGWRFYRPEDIELAIKVVALRKLGLSLGQVESVLNGDSIGLQTALAAHEDELSRQILRLKDNATKVRKLRTYAQSGSALKLDELTDTIAPEAPIVKSFELPWPWGGETFHVERPRATNFITGPLGSGKTRLAVRLAEILPRAGFVGLDRLADGCGEALRKLEQNRKLKLRVEVALNWLIGEGADVSDALIALLASLEDDRLEIVVVDLIEQGLSAATQQALGAYLCRQIGRSRPVFAMTRSSSILDLDQVGMNERIILCPPNHSPPMYVLPCKGAPGYEAVSLCLAAPDVRIRTHGVVAVRRNDKTY